jgi:fructoselysine-6-P-deglycase FrlB-like protein
VLLFGPAHATVRSLRARLRARGARVVVIGDAADEAARPDLPLPGLRAPGAAECVLATVRGQQLAVAAARALGVDPDRHAVIHLTPPSLVQPHEHAPAPIRAERGAADERDG